MNESKAVEIALFPIPNMVTFPYAVVPLHVFEPRYRKLIQDCLQEKRRIGVCHIVKTLHKAERKEKLEDQLKSNQDTYEPQPVFSAGFAELRETTEDGRFLIHVHMDGRYELGERLQEVPYQIYKCQLFSDEQEDAQLAQQSRDAIDRFLLKIAEKNEEKSLTALVQSEAWREMTPTEYSFEIFNKLQFDAEISQTILEMRTSNERLDFACRILNIGP